MAVGDAYGAWEWREGDAGHAGETAYRTEAISRDVCRAVCEYAFLHAHKTGAAIFGGPKYTVSPVYEGMFKEEMDAAHARYPDVPYRPQLIDATFALLLTTSGDPLVIPALNRDGDLPTWCCRCRPIAGSESQVIAMDAGGVTWVMAEAPHGTAPALEGKNVANPMAMILAGASLLGYVDDPAAQQTSQAIYESTLEAVNDGHATADLGGHAHTDEFTDVVIRRVRKAGPAYQLAPAVDWPADV
jgi:isocitrate/isopropylmalate dehydrogenase